MLKYSPRFFRIGGIAAPALLVAFASPFWEAKPPAAWTPDEVRTLLTQSPWAQTLDAGKNNPAPPLQVYIATAEPVQLAEDRARAAAKLRSEDPSWGEYRDYLLENTGKYIVFAVRVTNPQVFMDNSEIKHLEEESQLRVGKRKYKVAGYFPPSSTDPTVRIVFPRELHQGDRSLEVELYVPGVGSPYRSAEFPLKDLVYRGQPAL